MVRFLRKDNMEFKKYQHIERFGTDEVCGIEIGKSYVFPKIDGTNGSIWLGEDGIVHAGSRNRELSVDKDNAGFYNAVLQNKSISEYLLKHPDHRIFCEWLVPHSLKTYRDTAWRKFYIFDVCVDADDEVGLEYLPYDVYKPLLDEFSLEYLAPLKIIVNGEYDTFIKCLESNNFLIKDGEGTGEGIVIKNYDYYNKYHRKTWAKIVTSEFREKHHKEMGAPVTENVMVESAISAEFITSAFVEKEYSKITNEHDGWSSKFIPELLGKVYYSLINEEMWNICKKYKNPSINFKTLNTMVINKIKVTKPEIFG